MLSRLVAVNGHGGEFSERPLLGVAIGIRFDLHALRARFRVHHVDRRVRNEQPGRGS